MSEEDKKRRIAKDIVNYGLSNKYTKTVNSHVKYKNIIDNTDRSVQEIPMAALKYNWLMSVGETIKNAFDEDEYTNKNNIELWKKEGYGSAKEMGLRLVEEHGKYALTYDDPYYEEPY